MLELKAQPALQCTRGDFGVEVSDHVMYMPDQVARFSKKAQARSGEEFITLVSTFPSGVAAEFGWTGADVAQAIAKLKVQLQGLMDPRFLNPEPAKFSYGAMPPVRPYQGSPAVAQ